MLRKIDTKDAPKAVGPYSQAIVTEQFVFVSGQIPLDPKSGKIIESTIAGQTERVIDNIEAILKAEGLSLKHVVKVEIYLKDLSDAPSVNAIYAERFSHENKPARQMMQVSRLPLDSLIEISCIALISK